ncbi:MAG: hypothetical protein K0Q50_1737 [Vampirovibrio sp.]|jgi:hypothetical protein|nr:hypothetical protein [Vampirovibrio sp.]
MRNNKPFEPVLKLTPQELETILDEKVLLKYVEFLTGVPWRVMAAIWFREYSLQKSPKKNSKKGIYGGVFQFDPERSQHELRNWLLTYTKLKGDEQAIQYYLDKGVQDFEACAIFAACLFRSKVKEIITPQVSDEVIKQAFFGYNGKGYGTVDRSPYVMNGYDAMHMGPEGKGLILRGTRRDPSSGRVIKVPPTPDKRPGAFVVYKILEEYDDNAYSFAGPSCIASGKNAKKKPC